MALQGTIDTFPLTDVLALLETSAKSGLLTLTGSRGAGEVWFDGRDIVGGTIDGDESLGADRLLFELLRFEEGSFEFSAVDSSEFPSFTASPLPIATCVEHAAEMLEQWGRIESLVPSPRHRLSLAAELPVPELKIDPELWSFLVAVSNASTVADAAELLSMDSYESSAVIASLVEQGLVAVREPSGEEQMSSRGDDFEASTPRTGRGTDGPVADDTTLIEELQHEEAMWEEPSSSFPERFPIDDLLADDSDASDDPWGTSGITTFEAAAEESGTRHGDKAFTGLPGIEPVPLGGVSHTAQAGASGLRDWDEMVNMEPIGATSASSVDETADEVLRQMSKLSPKAAEAIAAALGSPSESNTAEQGGDDTTGLGPVSFLDSF